MSSWIRNHLLDQKTNSIVVIRHGHREEAKRGSFGNDLTLTPEGRQGSLSLGNLIAQIPIGEVHTSPVLRCIQTAEELLKGANQKVHVVKSKALGDPGPFIADPVKAGPLFLQKSLQEIAQAVVDGKTLPGMRSLCEGGNIFLNHISQVKHFPCLMISHDIIICLLCCFLFGSKNFEKYMPDFLEGFAMIIDAEYLSVYCRQQVRYLKRKF